MYRFSRSIYREIAPRINDDHSVETAMARRKVLDACEANMRRLAFDRRYFAHPAKSLFSDVRMHFPISEHLRVFTVIERNISLALEHLDRVAVAQIGLDGAPRACQASTRKGKPCQREPLPGRDYCPSHKHLEEEFEMEEMGAAA